MEELGSIKIDMTEFKKSLDFTEEVLENKVAKVKEVIGLINERVQKMCDNQLNLDYVRNKLIEIKERSIVVTYVKVGLYNLKFISDHINTGKKLHVPVVREKFTYFIRS